MTHEALDGRLVLRSGDKVFYVETYGERIIRFTNEFTHGSPAVVGKPSKINYTIKDVPGGILVSLPLFSLLVKDDFSVRLLDKSGLFLDEVPYTYVSSEPTDHLAEKEGHQYIGGTKYSFIRSFALSDESFHGLGDHPGPFDHRGYEYVNWNTDDPHAHTDNFPSLYKSSPFLLVTKRGLSFGLFLDNPRKTVFNCGVDGRQWFVGATGGNEDFYFIYGPSPADVVKGFASLIGTLPLPARWTLGYGQSRWSYESEAAVRQVVASYKQADIPLSSIYLDIDYMDGYRVFTVNKERFPHFKEFVSSLHKEGIKVVTILDPGVKADPAYDVYADGLKKKAFATYKGEVYHNEVWPGDAVYPAFNEPAARQWWASSTERFLRDGVDGLWCDMNEPASFKGPLPDDVMFGDEKHEAIHNLYGHYMAEATFEGIKKASKKRPFVITRACYSGTNRFSTVWTGDNQSLYSHLRLAIPQQLNMGLSLMPFVGTDIGGFSGNCPGELMARWIELGCFSPLFRNHSDCACHRQEAYTYPREIEDIYRKWVKFRYAITPYYYDLFYEESMNGLPVLRPLFMQYSDERFLNINTEFMVGPSLLVAPVLEPGAREKLLVLPKGVWHSYDMQETLEGGDYAKPCPLGETLVYVRGGSIVPEYPFGFYDLDKSPEELTLRLYPGKGTYLHYQDAGDGYGYQKGEYNLYEFSHDGDLFSYRLIHEGYEKYKSLRLVSSTKDRKIVL